MGLNQHTLNEIVALRRHGLLPDNARVCEIGAQQLSNEFLRSRTKVAEVFDLFGRTPIEFGIPREIGTRDGIEVQPESAPASEPFWRALGFDYSAVEYGGHRGAISLDLNTDSVPRRMRGAFDLVVNAGTTEHVVNQLNAFRVIHDLTKLGGIMVHDLPAVGMPTHGVVNYTMQFFWLLCRENRYTPLDLHMAKGGVARVPTNIVDSNRQYGRTKGSDIDDIEMPLLVIRASLRKVGDEAFVTPLDIPT
jgi:hypothetical protein